MHEISSSRTDLRKQRDMSHTKLPSQHKYSPLVSLWSPGTITPVVGQQEQQGQLPSVHVD